jgi:hypothetical protein
MNDTPSPEGNKPTGNGKRQGLAGPPGRWSPGHLFGAAAWIVFGPITGILSHQAGRAIGEGRRWAAAGYVALNVAILLSLPLATALLGHRFGHLR